MTSENIATSPAATQKISLRQRSRKPVSATGDVAATAIEYVLQRRASKRRGVPAAPIPESLRRSSTAVALHELQVVPQRWWPKVAAVVLGVIATGLVVIVLLGRQASVPAVERHAVHGTVTLRGRPLSDSLVEFHRLDGPGSDVETAYTDSSGQFTIGAASGTGVPSGEYGVVIRGRRRVIRRGEVFFEQLSLPPQYSKPDASPLKASVSGPIARLSLSILPQ